MYGLIGSFTAKPGKRDELVRLMTEGGTDMPGCISFVVSTDPEAEDVIWITEVWDSEASWKASLELDYVKASIEKSMPLIVDMGMQKVVTPVAGKGLT